MTVDIGGNVFAASSNNEAVGLIAEGVGYDNITIGGNVTALGYDSAAAGVVVEGGYVTVQIDGEIPACSRRRTNGNDAVRRPDHRRQLHLTIGGNVTAHRAASGNATRGQHDQHGRRLCDRRWATSMQAAASTPRASTTSDVGYSYTYA